MHPFSHVFSTESSSIDTVRLGQSCQRLFFYQKPALSNCSLSCLSLLIISTVIFIFVSCSLFWTNSLCLVGIASHLVVKMVRGAYTSVMKALCKDTFCADSKIEILNTVIHFTLRSAGTVVLWRMEPLFGDSYCDPSDGHVIMRHIPHMSDVKDVR
jgi:hypothetical protein